MKLSLRRRRTTKWRSFFSETSRQSQCAAGDESKEEEEEGEEGEVQGGQRHWRSMTCHGRRRIDATEGSAHTHRQKERERE